MTDPLVSVVIPVYNGAAFVAQAIESVREQTYPNVEVVVVDDGSTDELGVIADAFAAKDPRVRVIHKPNGGLSAARNSGIANARGAFLNFLDADDLILPDKIRQQLRVLLSRKDVDLVYSDFRKFNGGDGTVYDLHRRLPPLPFREMLVYRNWFGVQAPLLRRRLIDRVGTFDTAFASAEDWDFWYRCAQHTEFVFQPGVLSLVRLHGNQMTGNATRMAQAQRQFSEKHFCDDRGRRRSNRAAYHLTRAIHLKQRGALAACALHLGGFVASANSIAELQFVWNLLRWSPMERVGSIGRGKAMRTGEIAEWFAAGGEAMMTDGKPLPLPE